MIFIPTFIAVSITPGLCMTLAMTLGMTIGVRRSLWMMLGELVGVGIVATLAVIGVAGLMLNYPSIFTLFKSLGGAYLGYLGIQMWLSKGKMSLSNRLSEQSNVAPLALISQGFVTAIVNPKGWAFFISLLPPFIDPSQPLALQLSMLISLILFIEFISLLLYASGGRTLRQFLAQSGNVRLMNRVAGSMMMGIGLWLALG
jgi:threonine/homoserine/homoserine lactone efflux protein